jgi:hypothetical protein
MAMAHLEHQARLNYMAMCAGGADHPSIPTSLAEAVGASGRMTPPHLAARRDQIPSAGPGGDGGVWADLRERLSADL